MLILLKPRVFGVALLVAAASSLLAGTPAHAAPVAESSLTWAIESADGGDPQTGVLTGPDVTFASVRDGAINRITVTSAGASWSIALAAPVDEELHPGNYPDVERAGFQSGRAAGLDVTVDGSGCDDVHGRFTIHQIAFDAEGTITMVEASFARRCSADGPAARGDLTYNAFPLSYRYTLTDDDPATPASHNYRGATGTFSAQTFATNSVRFRASGDRNTDVVEFSPPAGETLTVGQTYRNTQPVGGQEAGRAGLSVDRFRCRPTTGNFTINELVYGENGEPVALSATFTVRCTDFPNPEDPDVLRGTIRFHA